MTAQQVLNCDFKLLCFIISVLSFDGRAVNKAKLVHCHHSPEIMNVKILRNYGDKLLVMCNMEVLLNFDLGTAVTVIT